LTICFFVPAIVPIASVPAISPAAIPNPLAFSSCFAIILPLCQTAIK